MAMCFTILPVLLKAQHTPIHLLVGTYTNTGKSEGIYVYSFDPLSGSLTLKNKASAENPSFLAISANKKFVYAVNELNKGEGRVSAFGYDRDTGRLTFLNTQTTGGDDPCHVIVDKSGKHVIASNYSGGNFTVFETDNQGHLTEKKQLIHHEGSGPNKDRQEKPHVHSAFFSPDEQHVLVQDLGIDRIQVYDYRVHDDQPISLSNIQDVSTTPGGGPRHITFSKNGKYVYLIQEMGASVSVYAYNNGLLKPIQEISILSKNFKGDVGAADIHLSPDGNFLYATNRGEANDIAIYAVNTSTGKLSHVTNQSTGGKGPRNFTIAPNGKFLLVANQYTNNVVVFERDINTGLLKNNGTSIEVGAPVCLVFDE